MKSVAPPNSYIFAEDFENISDLVEYIDYLDKNDSAYLEYHDWRNLYPPGNYSKNDTYFTLGNEEQRLIWIKIFFQEILTFYVFLSLNYATESKNVISFLITLNHFNLNPT